MLSRLTTLRSAWLSEAWQVSWQVFSCHTESISSGSSKWSPIGPLPQNKLLLMDLPEHPVWSSRIVDWESSNRVISCVLHCHWSVLFHASHIRRAQEGAQYSHVSFLLVICPVLWICRGSMLPKHIQPKPCKPRLMARMRRTAREATASSACMARWRRERVHQRDLAQVFTASVGL